MNDRRKKGLEKEISRIVGMSLLTEVKNEKIKNLLSVHKVELTKDGRYLDLTFSILDLKNSINKEKIMEDLEKLKGFFRKIIGSQLSIRFVPEVRVHLDDSVEHGIKISSILNEIKQKDSE
ncbi:30S ribosome-binding factor RbfA [Leptotrichia sp. OH3620_COT-345]|uniref:30S ribosome-binding factor RbfA n=1 Tax=Leptotrichia sp. OH3620_COT-345 TaxID=2491048 RepID=UPI000F65095F|nr:30S ribosome-binding factor RbfA [Leptotrichia sp. OH3620_COT-345]RRD38994.1 30S ribosome-binding factor RbfA [Leptotrichia sp. OH3620_COT-345]